MITQSRLKELFEYSPSTGLFTRIAVRAGRGKCGDIAGAIRGDGYKCIEVDGKKYLSHRLAWLYVHGEFPQEQIDHINGIRFDNRMENLRAVSNLENRMNSKCRRDAKFGIMGVGWHKRDSTFFANIGMGGKLIHLGYFDNLLDAICARKSAERQYKFHANHGRTQ